MKEMKTYLRKAGIGHMTITRVHTLGSRAREHAGWGARQG